MVPSCEIIIQTEEIKDLSSDAHTWHGLLSKEDNTKKIPITTYTYSTIVVSDITDGDVATHSHMGDAGWLHAVLEAAPVLVVDGQLKKSINIK